MLMGGARTAQIQFSTPPIGTNETVTNTGAQLVCSAYLMARGQPLKCMSMSANAKVPGSSHYLSGGVTERHAWAAQGLSQAQTTLYPQCGSDC